MPPIQIDGFTDVHTHILPGVDDGSPDLSRSLDMIRMARMNGTRRIILTPHRRGHYRKTPDELREIFAVLSRESAKLFPDVTLYLGNEIAYEPDVPHKLETGQVLTINDTEYALIEFQPGTPYSHITRAVSEVRYAGFLPVVAHIERYDCARTHPELAVERLELGALIQMNADSILGKHGFGVKRYCHKMLSQEKVHVIGSDAHNLDARPPLLRECFLRIHKKYGADYAARLFCHNPRALIENRDIQE